MPPSSLVVLRLDKNGRGGKAVTLLSGLDMHPDGKIALLRKIQKSLGTGGTLKSGTLEIQGDQRERIRVLLEEDGFKIKLL